MSMPSALTAAGGIDAVTHALEALVSVMASDYHGAPRDGGDAAIIRLPARAYEKGAADPEARQAVHNAATMAGMAFANAFLGVCHSMAHKLGAKYRLPHGVANALMIEEVIRFNAEEAPAKMAAFAQYKHPKAKADYARLARYLGPEGRHRRRAPGIAHRGRSRAEGRAGHPRFDQGGGGGRGGLPRRPRCSCPGRLRRPVHGSQPPLSFDRGDQGDVPEGILREELRSPEPSIRRKLAARRRGSNPPALFFCFAERPVDSMLWRTAAGGRRDERIPFPRLFRHRQLQAPCP